ncbi:MAG: YggU family protein [Betaproteobacteria bacterium HGW-Betaproteobacteria-12]|nr:MAG: YggU family protein [Betaproteobacteria bacterium HGW-Betaproteobacteria-12]
MNDWFRVSGDGSILLTLHIQPGASRSECAGRHGDALKIRLAAPPVDGKANAALIAFVAARLGIARAAVTLKSGQTSRRKILKIEGSTAEAVAGLAGST